jgi:hypothetical protein
MAVSLRPTTLTLPAPRPARRTIAGATAGRSEGLSANRGFQAAENDQGVLGEVFVNPNARTFARGRLFTERGYTIKSAGVYHFAKEVMLGIAARYQDGQHFARLVTSQTSIKAPKPCALFRTARPGSASQ